ncbi:hypothetical protein Q5P01_017801 [Channa striata]|uniref:Uncharacterized protein n=1 Tax=Channa striata TaxID=64152 RepID=A0AA88MD13_CHASR|nr:hypothetical protein Q5P01_017801 [Channa striata]
METHDPSLDDGGLWMKLDSSPKMDHTQSPSIASGETPQAAPSVITKYYSVMDDEDADDVFIPPPPPPSPPVSRSPLMPAGGSTDATTNSSSVTLSKEAGDATEAKPNPSSLDQHHGEKQIVAAQVDEVTAQISKKSMDNGSLPSNNNFSLTTYVGGPGSLMETCTDPHEGDQRVATDRNSSEETEAGVIVSAGEDNWKEADGGLYSKQNSKNDPQSDNERDKTRPEDIRENEDCDSVETNVPALSGLSVEEDHFKSCGTERHKCNQNKMDGANNQPQVPEIPGDVTTDDQDDVDTRSFDYNLTKNDWVRRESDTSEKRVVRLPDSESTVEMVIKAEKGDGSRKIATDIQKGEILLRRLQLVQQQQDVHMSESHLTSYQVVQETGHEEKGTSGNELDNWTFCEGKEKEKNEGEDTDTKARETLSSMPDQTEDPRSVGAEAERPDKNQCGNRLPSDCPSVNPQEIPTTKVPVLSARHRYSAAETSFEIQQAGQGKQSLQRAGGVFNLADDPDDVMEIPFKTNISLELFPPKVGQGQCSSGKFSEQKMQKEISQEIQRELVLVNQGKIPGGYSKGEIRQLKETKLLFEAFMQDTTKGPTRHRKPATSVIKGHVYPSVLERTRSLEMFCVKSCPVSRAHSLRLYKCATPEREKSPENLRSRSPIGGSRDKARLSPYPTKDKHLHVCRSLDSLSPDVSGPAAGTKTKTREGNTRQHSPILKHNPFFKLRPALALQPEVEKDIREAREREEELRRQRSTLYGEDRKKGQEEEKSRFTKTPDVKQSTGKLERVWPPPSKKELMKSEQTQQEPRVHRARGPKAPLWQRWESGLINGQPPQEHTS